MKRRVMVAVILCLALLCTMAVLAPAAPAAAQVINYTASEVMPDGPNMTSVTPCGNGVVRVTMANHLVEFGATHPWGNGDTFTSTTLVVHTAADGQWVWATTRGTSYSEGPWGVQEGTFTGWVSFITLASYYRFAARGVSGDVAGTVWTGSGYCPGSGDPVTRQTARVLIP
jgi:hypothetical protein